MTQPTMPEVFGRLTDLTGQMAAHAEDNGIDTTAPLELSSDRVLEGTDPENRATVTMADFKVQSIRFDPFWLETADREAVEDTVTAAVNVVLSRYLAEEIEEMSRFQTGIPELHARLLELSADMTAAFKRQVDTEIGRMKR